MQPARPVILLVIQDRGMGGVRSTLHSLTQSRLAERFEFAIVDSTSAGLEIERRAPRVVIWKEPSSWGRLPALVKLRMARARFVVQDHHYSAGFERHNVPSSLRFHLMLRLTYGLVDRVIAISTAQAEWMRAHRLVKPSRIAVIHEAPDLTPLFALAPPGPPNLPLVLGAYGRFAAQKAFDVLIEAMRKLGPGKVELHLAGGGPDEAQLRRLAEGLPHVHFVGAFESPASFLSKCDAIVVPSRWEPWGLVCQEAKAAARPVIASRVDGLTEQVNGCGLLVPPDNPAALAAAIAELCASPAERLERWSARGRASVSGALERYLAAWEKFLVEIAA